MRGASDGLCLGLGTWRNAKPSRLRSLSPEACLLRLRLGLYWEFFSVGGKVAAVGESKVNGEAKVNAIRLPGFTSTFAALNTAIAPNDAAPIGLTDAATSAAPTAPGFASAAALVESAPFFSFTTSLWA